MRSVEIDDVYEITVPEQPRLSAEDATVVFAARRAVDETTYDWSIYRSDLKGDVVERLTHPTSADRAPVPAPDGSFIAFTSDRSSTTDRPQLYRLPTDLGEAEQLTNVVGGVSSVAVSPDASHIAFVQSTTRSERSSDLDLEPTEEYTRSPPDPRVIDRTVYRTKSGYRDDLRTHVYLYSLSDGSVSRVTDGHAEFRSPVWGDKRTLFFTESIGTDPDDTYEYAIHSVDIESDRRTHHLGTVGWGRGLAATTTGKIAFPVVEPSTGATQPTDLHVHDTRSDATVNVTADLDRTLGYDVRPSWSSDEQRVYFSTGDRGKTAIWRVPADGTSEPTRVLRRGDIAGFDVGRHDDRDVIVASLSEPANPGEIVLTDEPHDEVKPITALNQEYLSEVTVAEPEPISFESPQGEVAGWVLHPPDFDENETYPLIVEVHGGPHVMWTTAGTMWHEFQALAGAGYVVFWCNPRGSSGYGSAYMQATERNWGDGTLTDVLAGAKAVADRPYIDETEVFLTGGSFGGYLTAWAVGQTEYFTAAVSQRGVYEYNTYYGTTDTGYKSIDLDFGTAPWDDHSWLWEQSPAAHVESVDTPILLLHSEDDYRTPLATAELYYRYLRKTGATTRLVQYPREGHELSRSGEPAHRVDRLERIRQWFDGYSSISDADPVIDN